MTEDNNDSIEYPHTVEENDSKTLTCSTGRLQTWREFQYDTPEALENNDPDEWWLWMKPFKSARRPMLMGTGTLKQLVYYVAPLLDLTVTNDIDDEVQCPSCGQWSEPVAVEQDDGKVHLVCKEQSFRSRGETCDAVMAKARMD